MQNSYTQIRTQLEEKFKEVYDQYLMKSSAKNKELSLRVIKEFIMDTLKEDSNEEVAYVMNNLHRLDKDGNKTVSLGQLTDFLYFHCAQMSLQTRHKKGRMSKGKERKMTFEEFQILCDNAFNFLKFTIPSPILKELFLNTDQDKDGLITYAEYLKLITRYFCQDTSQQSNIEFKSDKQIPEAPKQETKSKIIDLPPEQIKLIEDYWGQLRKYFDSYDKGTKGYLTDEEFRKFITQVLKQTSKSQQDYIFWNKFRIDLNGDSKIQYEQFAPFVLTHAGQIGLQIFHKENKSGDYNLTKEQFNTVFSIAFGFLKTIPKDDLSMKTIYQRIGKGSSPNYSDYIAWVNNELVKKIK